MMDVCKTMQQLLGVIGLIMDYRGGEQLFHAWRVAVISNYIARESDLQLAGDVFYASFLHDIGIKSPGEHPLNFFNQKESAQRYAWLRYHPYIGSSIVRDIPFMGNLSTIIEDHHEWWNGEGFPIGKRGDELSIASQLIRIADSYDMLLRSTKNITHTDIYDYFRTHKGKEFSDSLWNVYLRFNLKSAGMFYREIMDESRLSMMVNEIFSEHPIKIDEVHPDFLARILRVIGLLVDNHHSYTEMHSERVAQISKFIARNMGLNDDEVEDIYYAGYLHDLGKVGIPSEILDKPASLTLKEKKTVERHAIYTMEIIHSIEALWHLADIAGHSQEFYDGSGYPDGLKGDEIPVGSRIISVADAIDAMLSDRPYRKALSPEIALKELKTYQGKQFDPVVVNVVADKWKELYERFYQR